MIYYIDTNAILRYLLKDNIEQFNKANVIFEKAREGDLYIVVLESVLVECIYVLMKFYKVPKNEIVSKLETLLNYKGVKNSDKTELLKALQIFKEKNIAIVDCIVYSKAKQSQSNIFTFDEKLLKLK
ncbi:MAG TPA: PIN domain-containing protein [Spirochaetota bacterium]|nr:PIN domain-containing protein [Spirochaetota bacterium]HOM08580.1 PIN domain-containing protein [Spirochaetota bacterium]HPP48399.1 PIN domain-containing protein [Spirochaetota bacterium]HXK64678.1 PIN domain-containing protein [Spirochaetota bacterium]